MKEPLELTKNQGRIEALLRKIPGFQGYWDRENRRECDAMVRGALVNKLQLAKHGVDDFAGELAEAGQLETLPAFDKLRGRIDKLIGRIRGAMQGYSGFFELRQVDERRLERLYDFDLGLQTHVDEFADDLHKLSAGPNPAADPKTASDRLLDNCRRLEETWDQRDEILKGWE